MDDHARREQAVPARSPRSGVDEEPAADDDVSEKRYQETGVGHGHGLPQREDGRDPDRADGTEGAELPERGERDPAAHSPDRTPTSGRGRDGSSPPDEPVEAGDDEQLKQHCHGTERDESGYHLPDRPGGPVFNPGEFTPLSLARLARSLAEVPRPRRSLRSRERCDLHGVGETRRRRTERERQ